MIKIIVEDAYGEILSEVVFKDGERVLLGKDHKEYPLLSNLDDTSYDTFHRNDSAQLMREFETLISRYKNTIFESKLKEIILLLDLLNLNKGSVITFTPFSKKYV